MIIYAACCAVERHAGEPTGHQYENNLNAQEATKYAPISVYRERPHKYTSPNGLKALKYLLSHIMDLNSYIITPKIFEGCGGF